MISDRGVCVVLSVALLLVSEADAQAPPRSLLVGGEHPAFTLTGSQGDTERFLTMVDRCAAENEWFHDRLNALALIKAGVRVSIGRDLEADRVIIGRATPAVQYIDLSDVEAFPPYLQASGDWTIPEDTPAWATRHCAIILHELIEAFWMQRHRQTFARAHEKGLSAENTVGYRYGRIEARRDTRIEPIDDRTEFVVVIGTICDPDKYEERFNITGFAKLDRPTYKTTERAPVC